MDSFIIQLLPKIASSKINLFSCGHVVDVKKQLLPVCLGKGPSGKDLDYRFASRSTDEMIFETKRILQNWSRVIPAGIRVFQNAGLFSDHTGSCSETVLNYMNSTLEKVSEEKQEN